MYICLRKLTNILEELSGQNVGNTYHKWFLCRFNAQVLLNFQFNRKETKTKHGSVLLLDTLPMWGKFSKVNQKNCINP